MERSVLNIEWQEKKYKLLGRIASRNARIDYLQISKLRAEETKKFLNQNEGFLEKSQEIATGVGLYTLTQEEVDKNFDTTEKLLDITDKWTVEEAKVLLDKKLIPSELSELVESNFDSEFWSEQSMEEVKKFIQFFRSLIK
jgi:hypothetical protein